VTGSGKAVAGRASRATASAGHQAQAEPLQQLMDELPEHTGNCRLAMLGHVLEMTCVALDGMLSDNDPTAGRRPAAPPACTCGADTRAKSDAC
jgi:hypothetical protein